MDLNGIGRIVRERLGFELGRSTTSRFITVSGVPFFMRE